MTGVSSSTFTEVQKFRQIWLWLLMGFFTIFVSIAVLGELRLTGPTFPSLVGIAVMVGVLLLLWSARMTTTVESEGLSVRFFPFHRRPKRIALDSVVSIESRTYRPLVEYGGWGLRCKWGGGGRAFNVSGNRGVLLTFRGGKTLLIGSQRADELAAAIEAIRKPSGSGRQGTGA